MFKIRLNSFMAALFFVSCAASLHSQQLAIVTGLEGGATVTGAQGERHLLHLLDWLDAGSTLTTPKDARAVLVFADGKHCEIAASSEVRITPQGPQRITGAVRTLPALPPMPPLPAIAPGQVKSDRAGAVLFRSHDVEDLYPADPNTVLPDHVVLRFRLVEAGVKYIVDLRDTAHNQVFHTETTSNEIAVPSGVLEAGQRYRWSVTALSRLHHYGQAEFSTLQAATLASRAAYRNAVAGDDRDSTLARLAVDCGLGLWIEARDQLRTAVEQSPNNQPLLDLLKEAERTLQPKPRPQP
jgi:hypothetical protein